MRRWNMTRRILYAQSYNVERKAQMYKQLYTTFIICLQMHSVSADLVFSNEPLMLIGTSNEHEEPYFDDLYVSLSCVQCGL